MDSMMKKKPKKKGSSTSGGAEGGHDYENEGYLASIRSTGRREPTGISPEYDNQGFLGSGILSAEEAILQANVRFDYENEGYLASIRSTGRREPTGISPEYDNQGYLASGISSTTEEIPDLVSRLRINPDKSEKTKKKPSKLLESYELPPPLGSTLRPVDSYVIPTTISSGKKIPVEDDETTAAGYQEPPESEEEVAIDYGDMVYQGAFLEHLRPRDASADSNVQMFETEVRNSIRKFIAVLDRILEDVVPFSSVFYTADSLYSMRLHPDVFNKILDGQMRIIKLIDITLEDFVLAGRSLISKYESTYPEYKINCLYREFIDVGDSIQCMLSYTVPKAGSMTTFYEDVARAGDDRPTISKLMDTFMLLHSQLHYVNLAHSSDRGEFALVVAIRNRFNELGIEGYYKLKGTLTLHLAERSALYSDIQTPIDIPPIRLTKEEVNRMLGIKKR